MGPHRQTTPRVNLDRRSRSQNEAEVSYKRLNMDLAVHRLFTYPPSFLRKHSFAVAQKLADLGLFYFYDKNGPCLKCQYCASTFRKFSSDTGSTLRTISESMTNLSCSLPSKNVPMPEKPNFKYEAHRLLSLLQKVDWQHVNPYDLAKSGFYYTGKGDRVKCTFCNMEVFNWEKEDKPDAEHKRLNPDCPFLGKNKHCVVNEAIGSECLQMGHDAHSAFLPEDKRFVNETGNQGPPAAQQQAQNAAAAPPVQQAAAVHPSSRLTRSNRPAAASSPQPAKRRRLDHPD